MDYQVDMKFRGQAGHSAIIRGARSEDEAKQMALNIARGCGAKGNPTPPVIVRHYQIDQEPA